MIERLKLLITITRRKMKEIYKYLTLGLGTLITITVSMACSYWFFYSLMGNEGNEGYEAMGAGIAGCAFLLFGYGFSASFLPMNNTLRISLSIIPLTLSMFTTYSALYGYLTYEKASEALNGRKEEVIFNILQQSSDDKKVASAAAKQGVGQSYRSQAKRFLEMNDKTRLKDEALLNKLDETQANKRPASPLDGLVKITGNSELTTVAFCVWLAIMFDLLPVVSIGVFSRKKKTEVSLVKAIKTKPKDKIQENKTDVYPFLDSTIKDLDDDSNDKKLSLDTDNVRHIKQSYSTEERMVMNEINEERLDVNAVAIMKRTNWKKSKAYDLLNYCGAEGICLKDDKGHWMLNDARDVRQCA